MTTHLLLYKSLAVYSCPVSLALGSITNPLCRVFLVLNALGRNF